MARNFLAYWKPSTVDAQREAGGHLDHSASNQFRRVEEGDTVWLVTVRGGRLRLLSRIVVGHVTGRAGAARLLGCRPSELWAADHHILGVPGTGLELLDVDVQHLAARLRFESPGGRDRLAVRAGGRRVSAQQLQAMRVLAPASAELLAGAIPAPGGSTPATLLERELDSLQARPRTPAVLREIRRILRAYERPSPITRFVKHARGATCQLCRTPGFVKRDGTRYCEVHHLFHLSADPPPRCLGPEYLVVLCATCHRRMHYADVGEPARAADGWRVRVDGTEHRFVTR